MKVAKFSRLVLPLLMAGCANPRTFSGGGMGGGTPIISQPYEAGSATGPSPSMNGGGGGSLGSPDADGFSQRTQRPITPKTTPVSPPSNPANPPPPTKQPQLNLPIAGKSKAPTASITAPLGAEPGQLSTPVRQAVVVPLVWNRRHQSAQRRPIETLMFGTGERRILVMASLHGDEPQSVGMVEELAQHLRAHPEMIAGLKVLVVHAPNPDGLAGRTSVNSRGVDLNRNFPSQNWAKTPDATSGGRAASEQETQVLVRLTTEFRPQLVIHLKDSRDKGRVNAEGSCRELAESFAKQTQFEAMRDAGAKTSGSFENFAWSKLNCPTLTVLLPLEKDDPTAWQKNGSAVLGLLSSRVGDAGVDKGAQTGQLQPAESQIAGRDDAVELRPVGLSIPEGIEPLVPQRPTRKTLPIGAPVPSRGYHPLPAPGGR
jgi:protein MpaA